jgi:hypothetical protein
VAYWQAANPRCWFLGKTRSIATRIQQMYGEAFKRQLGRLGSTQLLEKFLTRAHVHQLIHEAQTSMRHLVGLP